MSAIKDELFELVFEDLDSKTVAALSNALLGIEIALPTAEDYVHVYELGDLVLSTEVVLGKVNMQVLSVDDDVYELELNFKIRDASTPSNTALVSALHSFSIGLAGANGVDSYLAGLAPATDEDTRWFTGLEKGSWYHLS